MFDACSCFEAAKYDMKNLKLSMLGDLDGSAQTAIANRCFIRETMVQMIKKGEALSSKVYELCRRVFSVLNDRDLLELTGAKAVMADQWIKLSGYMILLIDRHTGIEFEES